MQFRLIIGLYIIHTSAASILVYNLTAPNKLACHSCQGDDCQKVPNADDGMVVCNKRAQLCWAGYINHKPYRTCASRYCTPLDISLDSDVRIEMCCRSNLCNAVDLPLPAPAEGHSKDFPTRPRVSTAASIAVTNEQSTVATKTTTAIPPSTSPTVATTPKHVHTSQVYIVNEIVDDARVLSRPQENDYDDHQSQKQDSSPQNVNLNHYVVNWERIPYRKYYLNRVEPVTMSKLLVLTMPFFLHLLLK